MPKKPHTTKINSLFFHGFSLLFLLIFSDFPPQALADPRTHTIATICSTQLEHNSTIYVPNFVATMANISTQIRTSGYGTSVVGTGLDASYGLAQCYGDLSLLDCVLCYAEARTILPECYPFNGGRIYLDGCFMRAENYSFYGEFSGAGDEARCGNTTRKGDGFAVSARRAVSEAVGTALRKGGYGRAAVGSGNASAAYALANCWKTVGVSGCQACLENATREVSACVPWSEGRALNTGCFLRYSDVDFLNAEKVGHTSSKGSMVVMVIAIVSSVTVVLVGFTIGLFIWKHRDIQKKRKGSSDAEKMVSTLNDSSLNFKYSTLEKATESFNIANKLGQGGFGTVYRGALADGREVAVKRLFFNNRHRAADFYNEVNIISSVEHKNLVRLLGCSCSGPESLLVYEYLPNKSLDRFLFDPTRGRTLDWEKRFDIIIGISEGLVYLHENSKIRIIHRDIKASNILLDNKLQAKIADFGLARSFQEDKSHISTAIAGTLGYMAPEYLAHGQLTEKADVYSYGVLLLEIVSAKQNNRGKAFEESESLLTTAWKHFQLGRVEELIDPNLCVDNYSDKNRILKNEILRVVHIGLLCTQENPGLRPSMARALHMLLRKEEQLPTPSSPPFIDENTMELNNTCDDPRHPLNPSSFSVASISHSDFHPR